MAWQVDPISAQQSWHDTAILRDIAAAIDDRYRVAFGVSFFEPATVEEFVPKGKYAQGRHIFKMQKALERCISLSKIFVNPGVSIPSYVQRYPIVDWPSFSLTQWRALAGIPTEGFTRKHYVEGQFTISHGLIHDGDILGGWLLVELMAGVDQLTHGIFSLAIPAYSRFSMVDVETWGGQSGSATSVYEAKTQAQADWAVVDPIPGASVVQSISTYSTLLNHAELKAILGKVQTTVQLDVQGDIEVWSYADVTTIFDYQFNDNGTGYTQGQWELRQSESNVAINGWTSDRLGTTALPAWNSSPDSNPDVTVHGAGFELALVVFIHFHFEHGGGE